MQKPTTFDAPNHDTYFQENFTDPVAAAGLVRLAAPPQVVELLDLDNLKPLPTVIIDPDVGKRVPDLLFECPSTAGKIFVTILFEHKSYPEAEIAIQLLRYILMEMERHGNATPKRPVLVLPILVYHGQRGWRPRLQLIRPQLVPEALQPYILEVPAIVLDLRKFGTAFLDSLEYLDSNSRAALLAMKHIFGPENTHQEFMSHLIMRVQTMQPIQRARFLERTILYLTKMGHMQRSDAERLLDEHPDEESAMRFKSGFQLDIEEAKAQGIARAKVEDIEKMLAEGLDWPMVTRITGISQAEFPALKETALR